MLNFCSSDLNPHWVYFHLSPLQVVKLLTLSANATKETSLFFQIFRQEVNFVNLKYNLCYRIIWQPIKIICLTQDLLTKWTDSMKIALKSNIVAYNGTRFKLRAYSIKNMRLSYCCLMLKQQIYSYTEGPGGSTHTSLSSIWCKLQKRVHSTHSRKW